MTLYRINPSVVEPEWTERGLAKLLSDEAIVPVSIDYEAAIEKARTYLSHHASYEEQIHQAVDAALGGT